MTGDCHRDFHQEGHFFRFLSFFFEIFENFGKNVIFGKLHYRDVQLFFFRSRIGFVNFGKTVKSGNFYRICAHVFSFFTFFIFFWTWFSIFRPKWPKNDKNHVFLTIFGNFCHFWHFKKWPFLRHFLTTYFWTFWGGPDLIGKTRAFSRISGKPQKRVQKVVQKVVIFGTPKCPKWPKYWHFDGLPLGKMSRC